MTQQPDPTPTPPAPDSQIAPTSDGGRALIAQHKNILITRNGTDLAGLANGALSRSAVEPTNIAEMTALAQILAQGEVMQMPVKGSATETRPASSAEILGCILTGRDMGLSAMQSVRGLYNIGGKWSAYVKMQHAIIRASPLCKALRPIVVPDPFDRAIWFAWREGEAEGAHFEFTWREAEIAELATRAMWRKNPRRMLSARALGEAMLFTWPDLLQGLGVAEEILEGMASDRDDAPANQWSHQTPGFTNPPRMVPEQPKAPDTPAEVVSKISPLEAHAAFLREAGALVKAKAEIEDAAIQVADQPDLAKLTPEQRAHVIRRLQQVRDIAARPVDADAKAALDEARRQPAPPMFDDDVPF